MTLSQNKFQRAFFILRKAGFKKFFLKLISFFDTRINLIIFFINNKEGKINICKKILNKQSYDIDSLKFNKFISEFLISESKQIELIIVPNFLENIFKLSFAKIKIKVLSYSEVLVKDINENTVFVLHNPMLNQIIKLKNICDLSKTVFINNAFCVKTTYLTKFKIINKKVVWPRKLSSSYLSKYGFKFFFRKNTMDENIIEEVNNEYINWMKKNIKNKLNNIVDIGGHIGSFSLLSNQFLKKNGLQLIFEPVPENYKLIKKNILINNLNESIKAYNYAVSSESGTGRIFISQDNTGGSRLHIPDPSSKTYVDVKITTLSEILNQNNISFIDLLKIDVEGSEHSIIFSSKKIIKEKIKFIICEAGGSFEGDGNDILEFFKENEFKVTHNGNAGLMLIFAENTRLK